MRAVSLFLFLAFGISWAIAYGIHQAGGFGAVGPAGSTIGLMGFMLGPSVAAVICTLVFDRGRWSEALGFKGFGLGKVIGWTVWGWITAVLLTAGAVMVTVYVFGQPMGDPVVVMEAQLASQGVEPPMPVETLFAIQMSVGLLIGFAFNTVYLLISEELGWRGWLQPRLARLGFWPMSFVIGVIWGLWHLPVILMGHNYGDMGWAGVAAMVGFTVFLTPFHSFARERGGVIAAAGVHGAINAVAGLSIMYLATPLWPWNGLLGIGGFVTMAAGWVVIFMLRKGAPRSAG